MSHKQKAVIALSLASQSCTAALARSPPSPLETPAALETLYADLLSILHLISHSTTKLALLLKPPTSSSNYSAALPTLTDLAHQISNLAGCVSLFANGTPHYGLYLVKEVQETAGDLFVALRALIQSYLYLAADANSNSIHRFPARPRERDHTDEYLKLTGTIHQRIDIATGANLKASNGLLISRQHLKLSTTNAEAVKKLWLIYNGSVKDGFREAKDIITEYDSPSADANQNDDDEDDGWAELGIQTQKPNKLEIERIKQILPLLRLTSTLHTHLPSLFFPAQPLPPSYVPCPNTILDLLPPLSTRLLTSSDDLISTFDCPQTMSEMLTAVSEVVGVIKEMEGVFRGWIEQRDRQGEREKQGGGVEEGLAGLRVSEGPGEGEDKSPSKDKEKMLLPMFARVYEVAAQIEGSLT